MSAPETKRGSGRWGKDDDNQNKQKVSLKLDKSSIGARIDAPSRIVLKSDRCCNEIDMKWINEMVTVSRTLDSRGRLSGSVQDWTLPGNIEVTIDM